MKQSLVTCFSLKNITLKNKHYYLFLFLGSFIALLASPLAPFANKITQADSSVFIYCAQHILDGEIMYKEIFDHKGPLLYVFNILGILIGMGSTTGIWFVELVSLFVTLLYIYKSISLFWSKDIAFFSTLSCLLFFTSVFTQGNYAEEYSVLFISISLYYFVTFFKERKKIRYSHFSIIAVCFVCVFMLKANGIIFWLAGWIMVAFLLLKEKRMPDLLKIALISLGVIFLTLVPFISYLFFTDSFADFKYCYWDFNQAYSSRDFNRNYSEISDPIIARVVERLFFLFTMRHYNVYIFLSFSAIFFIFLNKTYKYKSPILFYFISLIATSVAISISDRNSTQYYYLYVPILSCFYAIVYEVVKKQLKSHVFLFFFSFLFIFHFESIVYFFKDVNFSFQKQESISETISFIDSHTQEGDKIYIIGNACIFYNLSHKNSASKYPYLFPIANIKKYRNSIINQFYQDMEDNRPKVICKSWYKADWIDYKEIPGIDVFLDENYIKVQNIGDFDCYVRKIEEIVQ